MDQFSCAVQVYKPQLPESMALDMSGLLFEAVREHCYDDESSMMTITYDDDSDASDNEVETPDQVEEETFDVELGADLSTHLGKDPSKAPMFSRFSQFHQIVFCLQAGNIQAAVQEMRLAAAAKRSLKQRSWAASFSFTKRSSKKPLCQRFTSPSMGIQHVVHMMRLASAVFKQQRSWAASFAFTGRSSKKPQFAGFAREFNLGHIEMDVQKMRLAAMSKRAAKQRSWAASYAFTKRSLRQPLHERFATPSQDLQTAVQQMRRASAAARASKHRSWAASFSFTGKATKKPRCMRFAPPSVGIEVSVQCMRLVSMAMQSSVLQSCSVIKCTSFKVKKTENMHDALLIEDVDDEIVESTANHAPSRSGNTMKMLMPPASEMEETRQKLELLLQGFQREVLKCQDSDIKMLERRLVLTEPSDAPVSFAPAEPHMAATVATNSSADCSSFWMLDSETDMQSTELETDLFVLRERCAQSLSQFQLMAALYKKEEQASAEVEKLIQEEQSQQEFLDKEVEQLIGEELQKASKSSAAWVAGSPAAAVRSMRRSASATFQNDTATNVGATGIKCSALSLDLGLDLSQCTPRESQFSTRTQKSRRSSSMAALRVTKSSLRPLVVSKSSSISQAFSTMQAGGHVWDSRQSHAWSMGVARRSFGNMGAGF